MDFNLTRCIMKVVVLTLAILCVSCSTTSGVKVQYFWSTVVFNSIKNSLSKSLTGLDYTRYQAKRLGLQRGERFPRNTGSRPIYFCEGPEDAQQWLQQQCSLLYVVDVQPHCLASGYENFCGVAFHIAPFVLQDAKLVKALEEGVEHLGRYSPSSVSLEAESGIPNLHAPGIGMDARTEERVRASILKSGLRPRLHWLAGDILLLTFDPR